MQYTDNTATEERFLRLHYVAFSAELSDTLRSDPVHVEPFFRPVLLLRTHTALRNILADVQSQIEHRQPRSSHEEEYRVWRQKAVRYRELIRTQLRRAEAEIAEAAQVDCYGALCVLWEMMQGDPTKYAEMRSVVRGWSLTDLVGTHRLSDVLTLSDPQETA